MSCSICGGDGVRMKVISKADTPVEPKPVNLDEIPF
jgi:hypothetical protein